MSYMILMISGMGEVYAQNGPPSGQLITNQATVSYINPDGEGEIQLFSNEVNVVVDTDANLDFWPNNAISEFRGNTIEFTHFVRNDGNVATTVDIKGYNATGDDFDLQDLSWTSEGLLKNVANTDTLTTSFVLEPGQEYQVSYIGKISELEERDFLESVMVFEATSREFGISIQNVDTISILVGAVVNIEKATVGVTEDTKQGDTFGYNIKGQNIGDLTALPLDISIDGNDVKKVIVTDSIPVNTSFVDFEPVEKGTPLYHMIGSERFEFTTTAPEDLEMVDMIGLALDSLQVAEEFELTFNVRIGDNATGLLVNTADVTYVDPEGTVTSAAASNEVVTELPVIDADIDYFTDNNFGDITSTSSIGQPLHIQADASACNENRSAIEMVDITITSELTGDMEMFVGIETGVNTGLFRIEEEVPTRDGIENEVVLGNKILETVEDDIIIASLACNGLRVDDEPQQVEIIATVAVDPFGIVFDSETNAVIEGAEVYIYDVTGANNGGNPGGLATVYFANGEEVTDNISNSDVQGKYRFPFLLPGTYRMDVIPPAGYEFSSKVPLNLLPEGRLVDSLGSFGMEFTFNDAPFGMNFDIPLDPLALGVLLAEKKVDRQVADIGDFVNYTINLKSQAVNTVQNMSLDDILPFGFEYQLGSAKLDGVELADPEGGTGPTLRFDIGDIDPGQTKVLTYRVFLGPGSERSDGINIAIVESDELVVKTSNQAKVKIEVRGGVFNQEALIVGKVFMDCDENNIQDGIERGIPGVRLYLENGNYVITDSEGRYTFYGIKANKHVLKIDNYSLPEGSKLKVLDNRHAFDPSSRFVDAKKGEIHRADFAICECSEAIDEEITRRADFLNGLSKKSLESSLKQNFSLKETVGSGNGNGLQASGTIGNAKAIEQPARKAETPGATEPGQNITDVPERIVPEHTIETALAEAETGVGFLNVEDQEILKNDKLTVWAKGTLGTSFNLFINGELIGEDRVGQRSASSEKRLQVWEYVSLDLQPGTNTILLEEVDPFGNVRGSSEITVYAPGSFEEIKLTVPRNHVSADGTSSALVRVEILDENGLRVDSRVPLTLDVSLGTWGVEDIDKREPGTQVIIQNGEAEFELISTIEPATAKVRANVGVIEAETKVEFVPDLRPLIAAGIIEGTLRLRDPLNIASISENDGFEQELKQLSYTMNSFTADGRFAFFIKGKVSGQTLLTAGYDSEKDKEERLFRDIRPEEYYPVYGESSVKGFDAQSSGRLYIRLDRNKTYALYGDFITKDNNSDVRLGAYSRSQNGVKTHLEKGNVQVEAFGVSSVSARRIEEFQGQGISRYELPDNDLIENSEIIELITYDRDQPSVILETQRLTRFTDYVIDPYSGVLTFKAPIFSVDSEFNPVFIRSTYEVEDDSERYLIGGVSGKVELTDGLNVGASIVQDNKPDNEFTLATGNVSYKLGSSTSIVGEIANTTTVTDGNGTAGRVEVSHKGNKYDVRAEVGKSDENFNNRGASLGQARTEAKARARYKLTSSTNLNGEFLLSRNDTTGDQTLGSVFNVQQSFAKGISAEVGLRYSEQTSSTSGNVNNTNIRAKVTSRLPFIKGASTFGEFEQDLNASERRLIAVGGDYKIRDLAKAYARHEFVSSAGGRYTLQSNAQRSNTVFGIDANYMKNGKVFSEYRMNDALSGRTGQASIGLRNRFVLREGFGLNAGFERIFTVQGPSSNDGTAISSSVDYTANPNWKGTARAEARFGANSDSYLTSFGYGLKINDDWTFLGRNIIALNTLDGTTGFQKLQERFQIGAAYRDTKHNHFDALFRYEFKYEIDKNIAPNFFRTAHIISNHTNYRASSDLVFSGRVAAKYSLESDDQLRSSSFLELISGRAIYDLNDRWDTGINASLMANSDFTTKDYGLGVELGYIMATNLRLATGFNFFGYSDDDLTANNYTQPGAYLGFSYKFDEQVFKSLAPERSRNFIDESLYLTCVPCEIPFAKTIPIDVPEVELQPVVLTAGHFEYEPLANQVILPRQIHFDNDMSYINPSSAQMLDKVAKFLMDEDNYIIDLSGFTDTKSSYEYNMALSYRRSKAVRAYLIAAGVQDRKLSIDGFGEIDAEGKNIIEMSMERRVEIDLNELNDRVSFIDQVEDLQVNQRAAKIGGWEYIFKSEHNAVPLNMNLTPGSAQLTFLNRYLIERIAIAMSQYPKIEVNIALPNDERFEILQTTILAELTFHEADINRFRFTRGANTKPNTVTFAYSNSELLDMYEQRDDLKFNNNSEIPELIESLLNVLKSREDYELIHDMSQSYVVPDRANFEVGSTIISNETQAVLSRIGSYLRNNEFVYLELRGDGSSRDRNRVSAMKDYLVNWGIDGKRVVFVNDDVDTEGKSIRIKYRNADSINLLNVDFLDENGGNR